MCGFYKTHVTDFLFFKTASLLLNVYRSSFRVGGGLTGRGVKLKLSSPNIAEIINNWSFTSNPHTWVHDITWKYLHFLFYL
jgi:hypothetical protein